jgi:hypothetical protein
VLFVRLLELRRALRLVRPWKAIVDDQSRGITSVWIGIYLWYVRV